MERIKKDESLKINSKSIEEKLKEAEEAFKENRVYSEKEVWEKLSKRYGFNL